MNVRARLEKLRPEDIVSFDVHYDALRFRAYRKELWGAAYLMNGGCSDDGFEYFRAWLISRGKKVYEQVLSDPDSLDSLYPRISATMSGEDPA